MKKNVLIALLALLFGVALVGRPTLRVSEAGWCVHTTYVMLCSE